MALRKTAVTVAVLGALTLSAVPAAGQATTAPADRSWFASVSNWGKWVSLGVAAGLTTYGALKSNSAQDEFTALENACRTDATFCQTGSDGVYLNPAAENLFQRTLRLDGQAQRLLVGGQVTLLVSGVMFLVDLLTEDSEPENIPFAPLRVYSTPRKLGLQLEF